jgi:hypothetical protein
MSQPKFSNFACDSAGSCLKIAKNQIKYCVQFFFHIIYCVTYLSLPTTCSAPTFDSIFNLPKMEISIHYLMQFFPLFPTIPLSSHLLHSVTHNHTFFLHPFSTQSPGGSDFQLALLGMFHTPLDADFFSLSNGGTPILIGSPYPSGHRPPCSVCCPLYLHNYCSDCHTLFKYPMFSYSLYLLSQSQHGIPVEKGSNTVV